MLARLRDWQAVCFLGPNAEYSTKMKSADCGGNTAVAIRIRDSGAERRRARVKIRVARPHTETFDGNCFG
jgi:hypothetical protein